MITAKVVGDKEVIERLKKIGPDLREELRKTIQGFGIDMVGYIGRTKLEGNPLKSHTHKLRDSLNQRFEDSGDRLTTSIGDSAEYAAAHEYGVTIFPKKGKYLKFQIEGQWKSVKQVTLPERSFMRSSLAEQKETFRQKLSQAVGRSLRKASA